MVLLYSIFIASVFVQLIYAAFFSGKLAKLRPNHAAGYVRQPVSIIICAHNEAANLKKNLPAILTQRYTNIDGTPLYEVIVVNDASTDDTEQVLKDLEQRYTNLWDVLIPAGQPRTLKGKKFALSRGAAHAAHNWLVLTDADCTPASDQWLQLMASPLAAGKQIVAGYGRYRPSGSWLNGFVRWETLHTFLQYSSYTLAGLPYMATGRNMACTKAMLEYAQKSTRWNMTASGDDDMLVNIAGNKYNMAIVPDTDAATLTDAKATFKEWVGQKQRHFSTGKYYNAPAKWFLGIYAASHALVWLAFFALLILQGSPALLWLMAVRCAACWALWYSTAAKMKEPKLFLLPLYDLGWMVYNFAFLPYISWKNKNRWT